MTFARRGRLPDMTETSLPSSPLNVPSTQPMIIERTAQPYVSIRRVVPMDGLAALADEIPGVFEWLAARGVEPDGAPFFKYNVLWHSGALDVEAGIPVPGEVIGDDRVQAGVLLGGWFAGVTHFGHFDGLREVTADLLDWGSEHGVTWDMTDTDGAEHWGLRLELYKTNPALEPDPAKWETELLFRLADQP